MKKAIQVAKLNFQHWRSNPKYFIVFVYLLLYSYERLYGLVAYARDLGSPITPWTFPFLPCSGDGFLPFMLGFVLLVSDTPFRTRIQGLTMQRVGKRTWLIGQLLFLLMVSTGFTIFMWILSWLWLLPELIWSGQWGAVLSTAAISSVPFSYHVYLDFPYAVMKSATPLEATIWCAATMTAVCFLLGSVMTACNLWLRKGIGAAVIAIISAISLILDLSAQESGSIKMILWLSPLNWMDYSLMGHPEQYLPSHAFAIWGPLVLGLSLNLLLILTIGKCNIETDRE